MASPAVPLPPIRSFRSFRATGRSEFAQVILERDYALQECTRLKDDVQRLLVKLSRTSTELAISQRRTENAELRLAALEGL
jgi:hypothetical protein